MRLFSKNLEFNVESKASSGFMPPLPWIGISNATFADDLVV